VEVALLVKQVLDALELESYVKTSGSDGIHVLVPIARRHTYDQARAFCEIVAWTDLYIGEDVAQVEDVATLEEHRGKGYATAVVLRAVDEARNAGADLVYLVADEEDWPKEWYQRLGFDTVGRIYKFIAP